MKQANWRIRQKTDEVVIIEDLGPWDKYPSVTNVAESVVEELAPNLKGRKLLYYDSDGQIDELLVKDGKFAGFAPGPK